MPDTEATPVIEIVGVTKRFGAVTAVDNVSFSVRKGELFFLLGPSGCGKTTLLRILAGLEAPDAGTVRLAGRDTAALPPHRRGAPMVFQNYALWPHLSVRDNVAFGLVERRVPKREVEARTLEALRRVGLEGYAKRMPGQLSGGQQQRVVLARALVLNPEVVLLDEPLSNLDAKLRLEMREEIERLHRETPITFVYVTHDQAEALSLADRMAVMEAGRLRAAGAPAGLYHRPPNRFCAEFLGEANLVPGRVAECAGSEVGVDTAFGRWRGALPPGAAAAPGDAVVCMVRPENLTPAPAAGGGNRLAGRVAGTRLNGSTLTVQIEAGELRLKAALLNRPGLDPAGEAAHGWGAAPEHVVILPAAEEGRRA